MGGPYSHSGYNGEEQIRYLSKELVPTPYIRLHDVMLNRAQRQLHTTLVTRHFGVRRHIIVMWRPNCRLENLKNCVFRWCRGELQHCIAYSSATRTTPYRRPTTQHIYIPTVKKFEGHRGHVTKEQDFKLTETYTV